MNIHQSLRIWHIGLQITLFLLSDGLRGAEGSEPGRVVGESNQQPLERKTPGGRESGIILVCLGDDCDNWWTALRVTSCKVKKEEPYT